MGFWLIDCTWELERSERLIVGFGIFTGFVNDDPFFILSVGDDD